MSRSVASGRRPEASAPEPLIISMNAITGIEVMASEIRRHAPGVLTRAAPSHRATGARVTITFAREAPLAAERNVRVCFDLAENGQLREFAGMPQPTHTTRAGGRILHHYRISHWFAPNEVMSFVRTPRAA